MVDGDLRLVELEARTLFLINEGGRLGGVTPPGPPDLPLWYVGRCSGGVRGWFRPDAPPGLVAQGTEWLNSLPGFTGVADGAIDGMRELAGAWGPVSSWRAGPAFVVEAPVAEPGVAVDLVATGVPLHPALESWVPDLVGFRPAFGALVDGVAVSICGSSRSTTEAAEAGAETAGSYRRRGLGRVAVAAWANGILAEGRVPFYGTTWENEGSQRLAASLGFRLFGESLSIG